MYQNGRVKSRFELEARILCALHDHLRAKKPAHAGDERVLCYRSLEHATLDVSREQHLGSEELVQACVSRAVEREKELKAWAHLDVEAALTEARARDAQPSLEPLHGVPIAIKDVIDVAGMPASYGSPIYAGHRPMADASCVAMLRRLAR